MATTPAFSRVNELCQRLNSRDFLTLFAPERQTTYCVGKNLVKCYCGTAPRLRDLITAYGRQTAEIWVAAQLHDLSEFCGTKDKLLPSQLNQCVNLIIDRYNHLKVTELMAFFWDYKAGEYGRFYGAVDGLQVMSNLKIFEDKRLKIKAKFVTQCEQQRKIEAAAKAETEWVTFEEYQRQKTENANRAALTH